MTDTAKITQTEFEQFQRLIYKIAGISLSDAKQVLLVGRLGRRRFLPMQAPMQARCKSCDPNFKRRRY